MALATVCAQPELYGIAEGMSSILLPLPEPHLSSVPQRCTFMDLRTACATEFALTALETNRSDANPMNGCFAARMDLPNLLGVVSGSHIGSHELDAERHSASPVGTERQTGAETQPAENKRNPGGMNAGRTSA